MNNQNINEKNIVRITMLILFLSLVLVYSVYWQVSFQSSTDIDTNQRPSQNITKEQASISSTVDETSSEQNIPINNDNSSAITTQTWNAFATWNYDLLNLPWFKNLTWQEDSSDNSVDKIPDLTWTIAYFDDLLVTETLWLNYKLILVDLLYPNIYYVYLWNKTPNYKFIAKQLSWNIYEMSTKVAINQNNLFWDAVTFINIPGTTFIENPSLQRKVVFMALEYKQDNWIIQVPYDKYHKSKKHIQKTFASYYKNN